MHSSFTRAAEELHALITSPFEGSPPAETYRELIVSDVLSSDSPLLHPDHFGILAAMSQGSALRSKPWEVTAVPRSTKHGITLSPSQISIPWSAISQTGSNQLRFIRAANIHNYLSLFIEEAGSDRPVKTDVLSHSVPETDVHTNILSHLQCGRIRYMPTEPNELKLAIAAIVDDCQSATMVEQVSMLDDPTLSLSIRRITRKTTKEMPGIDSRASFETKTTAYIDSLNRDNSVGRLAVAFFGNDEKVSTISLSSQKLEPATDIEGVLGVKKYVKIQEKPLTPSVELIGALTASLVDSL